MAIITSADETVTWYYKVTEFSLLFQTEVVELLPEAVLSVMIHEDYEKNVMPVVSIRATMSKHAYFKLMKHKNDVKIHLRIQKFYIHGMTQKESFLMDYIKKEFSLISDDNNENMYRQLLEGMSAIKSEQRAIMEKEDITTDLFLFNAEVAKNIRKPVNFILDNATVMDALTLILGAVGIKNVLLAPIENTTTYKTLIIPPLSLVDAIYWLDQFYGLYHYGTMFYFGMDRAYIVPYTGRAVVYEEGESVENYMFCPAIGTNSTINGVGQIKKKDEGYRTYTLMDPNTIKLYNQSQTVDVMNGLPVTVVDGFNGKVQNYQPKVSHTLTGNKKRIVNYTENDYVGDIYVEKVSSLNNVIHAFLSKVDANALEPNKRYRMIFEDTALTKKYGGNYILTSKVLEFVKNGDLLDMSAAVQFKEDTSNDRVTRG